MRKIYWAIEIATIVLVVLSKNAMAYTCSGTNYNGSGDWLINDTTSCTCNSGENITINGDILVYGNGNFSLNNCTLLINQTTDFQYYFKANDSSKINISNSIINSSYYVEINFFNNNSNTIFNSRIAEQLAYSINFYGNSTNNISNSSFGSSSFYGNSTNIIYNSSLNGEIYFNGNSNNTILNSYLNIESDFYDVTFYDNSTNNISNSTINGGIYFNGNSKNNIVNTVFQDWEAFQDNSNNTVLNSTLWNCLFYENSTSTITNSSFSGFYIQSGTPQNLTISNFSPGNFTTSYIKASDSNFTINLTNVNITMTEFFGESTSNNTIINSTFDVCYLGLNSNNYILNSNFSYTLFSDENATSTIINSSLNGFNTFSGNTKNIFSNSTINQVNFYDDSNNTIINSSITFGDFFDNSINTIINSSNSFIYFQGNSTNTVLNSTFIYSYFYENSSSTITNSNLNDFNIQSTIPQNLTISDFSYDSSTTYYVKASDSNFTINLTNVNISYSNFFGESTSNNTIINSTLNFCSLQGNSTNYITSSNFIDAVDFNENSVNFISNSSTGRIMASASSNSTISNISLNELQIRFSAPQNSTVSNLSPGNFTSKYIKANDSGFILNLTNVNISYIDIAAMEGNNTIINSTFNYPSFFDYLSSNTIINSTFSSPSYFEYLTSNTFINSTFNSLTFFSGNSSNTIINSTFNYPSYFYGYSNFTIINSTFNFSLSMTYPFSQLSAASIAFTGTSIRNWSVYLPTNATLRGEYSNLGVVTAWDYNETNVTRYFPFYAYYINGNPVSGATVSVKDNQSSTVWQGTTNSSGYAEPFVVFNSTNYGHGNFTLYVQKDSYSNSTDINFLTNTSIILTLPYIPPSTVTHVPSGGGGGIYVPASIKKPDLNLNMPTSFNIFSNEVKELSIEVINSGNVTLNNITIGIVGIPKNSYSMYPEIVGSLKPNNSTYFTISINTQNIIAGSYNLNFNITSKEIFKKMNMTLNVEEKPLAPAPVINETITPLEENKTETEVKPEFNIINVLLPLTVAIAVIIFLIYYLHSRKKPQNVEEKTEQKQEDIISGINKLYNEVEALKSNYDTSQLENELNLAKFSIDRGIKETAKYHLDNARKIKELLNNKS